MNMVALHSHSLKVYVNSSNLFRSGIKSFRRSTVSPPICRSLVRNRANVPTRNPSECRELPPRKMNLDRHTIIQALTLPSGKVQQGTGNSARGSEKREVSDLLVRPTSA